MVKNPSISISFLGTGKMATALIAGIRQKNSNLKIIAADINGANLENVKKKYNASITKDNKEAAKFADIIFLCVKPKDMSNLLDEIKSSIKKSTIVVSIAAGLNMDFYESKLQGCKIIRVMPNTPALVGEMAAAYCTSKNVTLEESKIIETLLSSSGIVFKLDEKHFDAITALSGSGPAFFAVFIDAMIKQAEKEGLPSDIATKLAFQTAIGTGKILKEQNLSPDELVKMVASPGGTTEAGLKVINTNEFKLIISNTIKAAAKRSRELGKNE